MTSSPTRDFRRNNQILFTDSESSESEESENEIHANNDTDNESTSDEVEEQYLKFEINTSKKWSNHICKDHTLEFCPKCASG